jgi:hypothetical protein
MDMVSIARVDWGSGAGIIIMVIGSRMIVIGLITTRIIIIGCTDTPVVIISPPRIFKAPVGVIVLAGGHLTCLDGSFWVVDSTGCAIRL